MLILENPPGLDDRSDSYSLSDCSRDSSDSIFEDLHPDSCTSVNTTFSDFATPLAAKVANISLPQIVHEPLQACGPVLSAVTAKVAPLPVRDPRAELSFILSKTEPETPKKEIEAEKADPEFELETFSAVAMPLAPQVPPKRRFKAREVRGNSAFLLLYALDTAARANGRLPALNTPEEMALLQRIPELRRFNKRYDLARILALSTKKIWDSVMLPPRSDPLPNPAIDGFGYCRVEGSGGLVVERGRHSSKNVPWAPRKRWLRPAGEWHGRQYTVRGWCPKRLLGSVNESLSKST